MKELDENIMNEITDSVYDCIDFLNVITDQCDLNKNVSAYIGSLRILKRELDRNLLNIQDLSKNLLWVHVAKRLKTM